MTAADPCVLKSGGRLPSLDAALASMRAIIQPIEGSEQVGLRQALGRILEGEILAPVDLPPFHQSAMDGYALRTGHGRVSPGVRLKVVGTAFAGHPFRGQVREGECVRIFTGAAVPEGADAVIMQEEVEREDDYVVVGRAVRAKQNIRRAGEEMSVGERLLDAGRALTAADLGLLASVGQAEVRVRRKLRVAFFSTGDELRPLGEPLNHGEIHDSNRYALHALLHHPCIEPIDLGLVGDDRQVLKRVFRDASACADAIMTSGGVSVGDADFVAGILAELGQVDFWKVAIKPGKPFAFGRLGRAYFFGLPGNPVAVMVTFRQIVRPALLQLMGSKPSPVLRFQAVCRSRLSKSPGRLEFQRGIFVPNDEGGFDVESCGAQDSHRLSSISRANCFIILSADNAGIEPGDSVTIEPFGELF